MQYIVLALYVSLVNCLPALFKRAEWDEPISTTVTATKTVPRATSTCLIPETATLTTANASFTYWVDPTKSVTCVQPTSIFSTATTTGKAITSNEY